MFNVLIPARYDSQRLPGKALLPIAGKPMIQHVYERSRMSSAARVVVATDDERVVDAVKAFGGEVIMTSPAHPSGTDRLQEAAQILSLGSDEIVVNVQGDEPLIPPNVIEQVAANLVTAGTPIASLYETIVEMSEVMNPNNVKVVTDESGIALYFSRSPIPFDRSMTDDTSHIPYRRHLGLYAYRVAFLNEYVTWPEDILEKTERLEQLRALAHGRKIHLARACESIPPGVDTAEDLERTRRVLEALA